MKKRMSILFMLALLLLGIYSTVAQDVTQEPEPTAIATPTGFPSVTEIPTLEPTPDITPTPEPVLDPVIPPDVMTPEDAGNLGLNAILAIVAAFAGSALTATIVSVLKMFVPSSVAATLLKNVVGGALTILYWLAVRYGFGEMFESIGQFLITFVPAFLQLYGTLVGSSVIHRQAVAHGVPILSYQRTP